MIDEKKLIEGIQNLYAQNEEFIQDNSMDLYFTGKRMGYIDVNELIKNIIKETNK